MASWKRVKEESVKDLGMLLMVGDDDRSACGGGLRDEGRRGSAEEAMADFYNGRVETVDGARVCVPVPVPVV